MHSNEIRQLLDEFSSHVDQLQAVLAAEKRALVDRDVATLESTTEAKQQTCEALSNPSFNAPLKAAIESLEDQATRAGYLQRYDSILTALQQARDSNLVNGKLLARSQNSVREILNLLSGRRQDGLYSQSGQPKGDADGGGKSIAEA